MLTFPLLYNTLTLTDEVFDFLRAKGNNHTTDVPKERHASPATPVEQNKSIKIQNVYREMSILILCRRHSNHYSREIEAI